MTSFLSTSIALVASLPRAIEAVTLAIVSTDPVHAVCLVLLAAEKRWGPKR